MRGAESHQSPLFSYVSLEDRIPKDHPLRVIKALVDPILRDLSPKFDALYAAKGRPSIPPEMLLRALLVQILGSRAASALGLDRVYAARLLRFLSREGMLQLHEAGPAIRSHWRASGEGRRPPELRGVASTAAAVIVLELFSRTPLYNPDLYGAVALVLNWRR